MQNIITTKTKAIGNLQALIMYFLSTHPNIERGLRNNISELYQKQRCPGLLRKYEDVVKVRPKSFKKWVSRNALKLLNKKKISETTISQYTHMFITPIVTKKGKFDADTQKIFNEILKNAKLGKIKIWYSRAKKKTRIHTNFEDNKINSKSSRLLVEIRNREDNQIEDIFEFTPVYTKEGKFDGMTQSLLNKTLDKKNISTIYFI